MGKGLFFWLATLLIVAAFAAKTDGAASRSLAKRATSDEMLDYNDDAAVDDETQNDDADDTDDDLEDDGLMATIVSEKGKISAKKGQTVWLPCEMENYDDNTVFSWQKGSDFRLYFNLQKITDDSRIILHANKTLSISNVDERDEAVYTCEIIGGNSVRHEVKLLQAPKITKMYSRDKYIKVGEAQEIFCEAIGVPEPKISWRKEIRNASQILTSADVEFRPSSIYISNVQRSHEGKYICMADNNVGMPAVDYVPIVVVGEPRVHIHKTVVNADYGAEADLVCQAHEQPESNIKWTKNGVEIQSDGRHIVKTVGQKSTLIIRDIEEGDFGQYTCVAQNQYGSHSRSADLVKEPVLEDIVNKGSTLSSIIHSHAPLNMVEIMYRRIDGDDQVWKQVLPKTEKIAKSRYRFMYALDTLEPGKYEARIRANNTHGWNNPSNSLFFEGGSDSLESENIRTAGVGGAGSGSSILYFDTMTISITFLLAAALKNILN